MCGCGPPVVWAGWSITFLAEYCRPIMFLPPVVDTILRQNHTKQHVQVTLSREISRPTGAWYVETLRSNSDSPVCRPFLLASFRSDTRARECTTVGFLIIKPSRCRRAIFLRELAKRNFVNLVGIQPNLAFSALEHGRRKAFLKLQRHC